MALENWRWTRKQAEEACYLRLPIPQSRAVQSQEGSLWRNLTALGSQWASPPWIFTAMPAEDPHIFTDAGHSDITTWSPCHSVSPVQLEMLLQWDLVPEAPIAALSYSLGLGHHSTLPSEEPELSLLCVLPSGSKYWFWPAITRTELLLLGTQSWSPKLRLCLHNQGRAASAMCSNQVSKSQLCSVITGASCSLWLLPGARIWIRSTGPRVCNYTCLLGPVHGCKLSF